MKTLSLCLIIKNEEKTLDRCLQNAHLYADEIIVVDTGSTDKSKEIAKKYTDLVFDFEWCDDFSKARNYSFDKAKCEYIMWLDGDDMILQESAKEINRWKKTEEKCDFLMCRYVIKFDENYSPIFQYYRERIIKNNKKYRWHDRVHEAITPSGIIIRNNNIAIYHNKIKENPSQRNLKIYQDMIEKGQPFSPRNQFYYARELYFNGFIQEAIHQFSKFLVDDKGWVENKIEACLNLARCYQSQKDYHRALTSLFGSFVYSLPRGEILYEIGNCFFALKDFASSIYWYKLALQSKTEIEGGGFVDLSTSTLLPALQLCVAYCRLGKEEEAYKYHLIAKEFAPDDERVKYNSLYFAHLFSDKKEDEVLLEGECKEKEGKQGEVNAES